MPDPCDGLGLATRARQVIFVAALRGRPPDADAVIMPLPDEEGQVDPGDGPHPTTGGECRRARLLVPNGPRASPIHVDA